MSALSWRLARGWSLFRGPVELESSTMPKDVPVEQPTGDRSNIVVRRELLLIVVSEQFSSSSRCPSASRNLGMIQYT